MNQAAVAAREARDRVAEGDGVYFRRFAREPRGLEVGTKIYYVEEGHVRGYAVVDEVSEVDEGDEPLVCETTGKEWPPGVYAIMRADSWKWIEPIRHRGFQGFRYFDDRNARVVGGWLDPKPRTP
jgi:hypothetical protein